jgi:hypothetical protein
MLISSLLLLRQHLSAAATRWQTNLKKAFTPYRPELHYMRGRGPKWHAKHRPGRDTF